MQQKHFQQSGLSFAKALRSKVTSKYLSGMEVYQIWMDHLIPQPMSALTQCSYHPSSFLSYSFFSFSWNCLKRSLSHHLWHFSPSTSDRSNASFPHTMRTDWLWGLIVATRKLAYFSKRSFAKRCSMHDHESLPCPWYGCPDLWFWSLRLVLGPSLA